MRKKYYTSNGIQTLLEVFFIHSHNNQPKLTYMEEKYRTAAAAVGASTKLHIELDGGISLDFDDAELCQELGLAIRDHYLKSERQSAIRLIRRKDT